MRDPLKTHIQKKVSSEGEEKEVFLLVDAKRFVTSSANVPLAPKYFVVNRKEGDLAKASLFLIEKGITGCAGSVDRDVEAVSYTHLDVYKRQYLQSIKKRIHETDKIIKYIVYKMLILQYRWFL